MIDTIVENARILDGTGAPPFSTDLAIVAGRIALLGDLAEREALQRLDARGLALAPGFIDTHSHADARWLTDRHRIGKIAQGVTTEIGGTCGVSIAPSGDSARTREWNDLSEFLDLVDRGGVALNIATLVGLSTTREIVRGDRPGALDATELRAQRALVRAGIEQGALGVSSGLSAPPGCHADRAELIACAREAQAAGQARYVTHLRDEGDDLLAALDEALEVGRRADAAVHCSHHKAAGKRNWGKVHDSLSAIDRARATGLAVHADASPYTASHAPLSALLPQAERLIPHAALRERLRDPERAAALAFHLQLLHSDTWPEIALAEGLTEQRVELTGLRLDTAAAHMRLSPARLVVRLLAEERSAPRAIFFDMDSDDVAAVLTADFTCVGSGDGVAHPRAFGTFPRILRACVRQRKLFELPEAIRRMTSLPAQIFGLADRGRIALGAHADLVLFDPAAIADTADYEHFDTPPVGIAAVFVNGTLVLRDGKPTGACPGRALRGGKHAGSHLPR